MRIVGYGETRQGIGLSVHQGGRAGHLQGDIGVLVVDQQQPFKAVFYVVCRQRAAVGKNHPVPQDKIIGQSVRRHGKLRAKAPHHLGDTVHHPGFKQTVEYVHRDHIIVRRSGHVHGGDVVKDRGAKDALLRRFRRGGQDGRTGRQGQGCSQAKPFCRSFHDGFLLEVVVLPRMGQPSAVSDGVSTAPGTAVSRRCLATRSAKTPFFRISSS